MEAKKGRPDTQARHVPPGNFKNRTLRNAVSIVFGKGVLPPRPKNQFPRQGWSSIKFSLKSKLLSEIGQFSRGKGRGGEWQ